MPILTQVNSTKFRSLKYGGDRLNGGSSSQPYIQTPIPENSPGTGGPDFLLRGGLLTPKRILNDVSRITQMFFDTRSLNGLLFTAKQNILSLTNVNTKAGTGVLNNILDTNSKIYLPTSTIAQVALTAEGGHLSKQGVVPTNVVTSLFDSVLNANKESRVVNLYKDHIIQSSTLAPVLSTDILYSYSGGPGSVLGIGQTNIKIASDRTGINNPNIKISNYNILNSDPKLFSTNDKLYRTGATSKYVEYLGKKSILEFENDFNQTGKSKSSFKYDSLIPKHIDPKTYISYKQLSNQNTSSSIQDFRTQITGSVLYSKSLNYKTKGIDKRIGFNPVKPTNTIDYSITGSAAFDKINASGLYYSSLHDSTGDFNDLVKFRIAIIDNDAPDKATYMHFRAYIDSFSDSYNSEWDSLSYVGRGEKFYRFNNFTREISLSWTVAAQSKAELIPMYHKLNYLASSLAPDYSKNGYMRGNMVKLTVGGYLYEHPGILTSMTLDIPQESTWEIGVGTDQAEDNSVKELPHIIRVTGVRFIPIHTFVPQLFDPQTLDQKYIALANGFGDQKNNYVDNKQLYK